ncbi:putative regulator of chromosome condensation protein [Lasiosphaeria hispida]|uniref:Regulator of chromosome condensation protein n=1 Tax=Lasiosphaeria hispida TaxID=260671 RepID=A0AAJ0MBD8_9PEZI|nr:putative regulator of chromosome condensation protein [Lasiosphaeria hispida]
MPPRRAAAAAKSEPAAAKKAPATKKTTVASKAAESKKAAAEPKKTAAATKKPTAAKTAAAKTAAAKTAAAKTAAAKAAAAKTPTAKLTAAAKKPTGRKTKAATESDKENVGAEPKAKTASKRKRSVDDEEESAEEEPAQQSEEEADDGEADEPAPKRPKKESAAKVAAIKKAAKPVVKAAPKKPVKEAAPKLAPKRVVKEAKSVVKKAPAQKKVINQAPTQVMDIFVFGEGSSGELGLGAIKFEGKKPIDVKRPRINHNLKGVVQVACGGMHAAALTRDNKILTWGVNDQGALGRDTTWEGGLRDVEDEDSDSDDEDDSGLNPHESTPAEVNTSDLPEGTKWVQIVASDSATFALTETGLVYGWGTFRSNEGILGFSKNTLIQKTPAHIPELTKIKQLAAGSNHILALDEKNKIFAWGAGQQAQLARRLLERDESSAALYPTGIGALPGRAKAEKLSCGSYHCFVIDKQGRVIGWGLNNYAELGIEAEAGTDGGYVMRPQIVDSFEDHQVASIAGGEHHSLACTTDGTLLTWGRIDGHQVGQKIEVFTEQNTIFDDKNNPRILLIPEPIPEVTDVVSVAAGTDHSLAITKEGKVYTWGFSANYQTGQGVIEDVKVPTLIDNTAIRNRKIIWAGAGGQYSILGAEAETEEED